MRFRTLRQADEDILTWPKNFKLNWWLILIWLPEKKKNTIIALKILKFDNSNKTPYEIALLFGFHKTNIDVFVIFVLK